LGRVAIRARAAEETESAVEEAQPGQTEEVEIPRSKVVTIAVAFPDDEPVFALPAGAVASVRPISSAAKYLCPQSWPHRSRTEDSRRKFNQHNFTLAKSCHATFVRSATAEYR